MESGTAKAATGGGERVARIAGVLFPGWGDEEGTERGICGAALGAIGVSGTTDAGLAGIAFPPEAEVPDADEEEGADEPDEPGGPNEAGIFDEAEEPLEDEADGEESDELAAEPVPEAVVEDGPAEEESPEDASAVCPLISALSDPRMKQRLKWCLAGWHTLTATSNCEHGSSHGIAKVIVHLQAELGRRFDSRSRDLRAVSRVFLLDSCPD